MQKDEQQRVFDGWLMISWESGRAGDNPALDEDTIVLPRK
jgi:hypothetical protein